MENRFGVRDLIHVVLLLAVIVLIGVSIFQVDRQWDVMEKLNRQMQSQTENLVNLTREQQRQASNPQILELKEELTRLRETLERGVVVSGAAGDTTSGQSTAATQPASNDGIEWGPIVGRNVDPFARAKAIKANSDYSDNDNFVDIFAVTPDKLTPWISTDAYASMVQARVIESLAQRNPETLEWEPLVAQWWRVSKDGLHIEFEIRRGVNFSDGVELTADDVVFTFEWMMHPDLATPRLKAYYQKIKSVTKVGPYRVRFSYDEPYFKSFELAAGMDILPKHFYSKYTPRQFNESTGLLLGSGPYRLETPDGWRPEPGKPIISVRNERYWGESAPYRRLIWRVIQQDSTRLTAFRNGEIDNFVATPEQYLTMLKDQELLDKTHRFEFQRPTSGYRYLAWVQKKSGVATPFADVRIRRAMTMLIDRDAICRDIYHGYAQTVSGPFSAQTRQANPNIKPWPFDPQQAARLLAEAGYASKNRDGVLVNADGKPLTFKLSYPNGSEPLKRMAVYIKDNLARAGVLVDDDPLEWNVLLERLKNRELDAYIIGWTGNLEGDPYQIFHSSQIEKGDNTISYANPELDRLIDEARKTIDEDKRMAIWHQVHQILHDDQPYTFLMTSKVLFFADKRFKNIRTIRTGITDILEWYVPQGQSHWVR